MSVIIALSSTENTKEQEQLVERVRLKLRFQWNKKWGWIKGCLGWKEISWMGWSKESCSKEKEYGEETRREMFQLSPQDEPYLAFSSSSRQDLTTTWPGSPFSHFLSLKPKNNQVWGPCHSRVVRHFPCTSPTWLDSLALHTISWAPPAVIPDNRTWSKP